MPEIRAAADVLKQRVEVLAASTSDDLDAAFETMVQHRVGALIVVPDPFSISRREQLVELAAQHAIPAIYPLTVKHFPEKWAPVFRQGNSTKHGV